MVFDKIVVFLYGIVNSIFIFFIYPSCDPDSNVIRINVCIICEGVDVCVFDILLCYLLVMDNLGVRGCIYKPDCYWSPGVVFRIAGMDISKSVGEV